MRSLSRSSLAAALLGLTSFVGASQAAWCQTTTDPGAGASSPAPAQVAPSDTAPSIAAPVPAPAPVTTTITTGNNGDSGSVTSSGTQTAPAPKGPHYRQFSIGPEIGLFVPASSKTRNRFGSSWFSIGIGIGDIIPPRHGGDLSLDLNVISQAGDNKHAYLIPVGVQYRQALNRSQSVTSTSSVVPYIGVSADVVFADVRSPQDGAHSGLRTTGGGSVFVGTSLTSRAFVEARYLLVGSAEHFNLSGFDFSAGFRF